MYKTIFSACATTLIALAATTTLGAENVTKNLDLSSFKGIEASTSCEIRLEESAGYKAELSCSEEFQDYIEVYVKNNVLIIDMNTKSLPAELKKIWKAKDLREPQFIVTVGVPSIDQLELSGDAHIVSKMASLKSDNFTINLSGRAKASGLTIEGKKINIKVGGNSTADMKANCEKVSVNTSGSGVAEIRTSCSSANVNSSKSSNLTFIGDARTITVEATGGCMLNLLELTAGESDLKLENGSTCLIPGTGKITLEMKGSQLNFKGEPLFGIKKLTNSSVEPYVEEK